MKGRRFAGAAVAGLLFASASGVQAAPAAQVATHASGHPKATAVVTNGSWPVYHHDNAHTGFDATQPTAAGATTGWTSGTFDHSVYAEPLVYQGVVYVATLGNTVYALNQADGSTLWVKNLGVPETGGWVCGNINPQGILGTPVVDTTTNRLYVAAFQNTDTWTIFGLDLGNLGNVVLSTTIPGNFAGGAFDWKIQGQRGALAVANGYVYVPFGGRAGDCNDLSATPPVYYQAWVIGVPTSGTGSLIHWNNGGSGGAGIWSPGGVVIDDSTSRVFVTTGNGNCPNTYDNYNDGVIRLSPSLGLEDYFAPQDWHNNWDCNDQDLGSAGTTLISPTLAFQAGKWGTGFLVNPQALGGVDGQLFPTPSPQTYTEANVCFGNHHDATFGSFAYAAPYVYLSCDHNSVDNIRGGLVGLKVDTTAKSFSICDATCAAPSWHTADMSFGPPIVAAGAVWVVDQGGTGLYGFDAATGTQIFKSAGLGSTHFTTPTEAGGQVFVASGTQVHEFNLVRACTSATLTPAPTSPQAAGTPVTLTAGVSSCPSPLYKFWIQPPGGAWGVVQPYGPSNMYAWNTTGPAGVYNLEVDIKNTGSTATYDSVANITFTTTGTGCPALTLTPSLASPRPPGTQVIWTASGGACPNPRYRFWELDPGSRWSMVQDYSAANTYTWNSPSIAGSYRFEVDVRDASETVVYDSVANATYVLQSAPSCTTAGLSALPASPGPTGANVTLTGTSATCPNPRYRFWIQDPGRSWSMVQDYSAATTHSWPQTGLAGSYHLEVDIRDASETTAYDVVANVTYALAGCTAAGLTANPATGGSHGTLITLTATSTCPGTATYLFWVKAPGGSWQVVQPYGTGNTFSWTPATAGTYSLEVDVRDQGGTDTYEKVANLTYGVT